MFETTETFALRITLSYCPICQNVAFKRENYDTYVKIGSILLQETARFIPTAACTVLDMGGRGYPHPCPGKGPNPEILIWSRGHPIPVLARRGGGHNNSAGVSPGPDLDGGGIPHYPILT